MSGAELDSDQRADFEAATEAARQDMRSHPRLGDLARYVGRLLIANSHPKHYATFGELACWFSAADLERLGPRDRRGYPLANVDRGYDELHRFGVFDIPCVPGQRRPSVPMIYYPPGHPSRHHREAMIEISAETRRRAFVILDGGEPIDRARLDNLSRTVGKERGVILSRRNLQTIWGNFLSQYRSKEKRQRLLDY